jgi:hypothetical protein
MTSRIAHIAVLLIAGEPARKTLLESIAFFERTVGWGSSQCLDLDREIQAEGWYVLCMEQRLALVSWCLPLALRRSLRGVGRKETAGQE